MGVILTLIAAIVATIGLPISSSAVTGPEIIERSEAAIRGDTQIALIRITIKRRRWTRVMEIKSWDDRIAKKSFVDIIAPKKDAGNKFLMITREKLMWEYNPDIGRVMKIFPSMMLQSWMGSDFTNDDIVKESSIIQDYTHVLEGRQTVDGMECYKVRLVPKPEAAVVWGKLIYFARINDFLPVRQEFYDQHGNLKKLLTCENFRHMGGRVIPAMYKMVTMKRHMAPRERGHEYTVMELIEIVFNARIDSHIFTIQNLSRR